MIYDVKYLHTILLGWEFPRVGIEAPIKNAQTWLIIREILSMGIPRLGNSHFLN